MVMISSVEEAMRGRWSPHANTNFRTQFMGEDRHKGERPDPKEPSPIAYLVEQGPHTELRAHFHEADQFQIFVSGEGRIGGHAATPGKGHFVGPFSGYGPIVAGDKGLAYMTLRNAYDPGAQWLPENVERIRSKRSSRREVMFQAPDAAEPAGMQAVLGAGAMTLVEAHADGLASWSYGVRAGECATGSDPAAGGGQFWVVLAGTMMDAERGALQRLSMAFVRPEDGPYTAKAGPEGLHVLVVQFPKFTPR